LFQKQTFFILKDLALLLTPYQGKKSLGPLQEAMLQSVATCCKRLQRVAMCAGGLLKIPKGFMTVNDAAEKFGVHRTTIFRLLKKKKVKLRKFFNFRLVSEKEIERLVVDGR
jgi:DNA-binding MurR/RpiR family transcriptional regulator